jgi:membrane protein
MAAREKSNAAGTNSSAPKAKGQHARRPWQIPSLGWREIAVRTWKETGEDNISLLAAGVAFYSFLAFVPLLASIVLVYGIAVSPSEVAEHMQTLVRVLPSDAAKIVGDQLKSLTEAKVSRTTLGLILAILLALYGAMRGATSVIAALNITYEERETRSFIRTTALSFAFTVGAVVVAIVAMVAISAMTLIGTWIHLPRGIGPLVSIALWVVTALVASVLVAIVYRYGPARDDAEWSWLTPGAVFASVGALLATFLFGLYVSHFAGYNATYGALGAVVSFLMWLYVTAFVILLGAELNAEIERQTAQDTTTGPEKPLGERRAAMADTVADGPATDGVSGAEEAQSEPQQGPSKVRDRPRTAADEDRVLASKVARTVGTMSDPLLPTDVAQLDRRGQARAGLVMIGAGAMLLLRGRKSTATPALP